MSSRRSRQYQRVAQACENCRRKKIRCPGERPRCSACARFNLQCSFSDSDYLDEQAASRIESRMADRIMQLENKLDSFINTLPAQPMQEPSPYSVSGRNPALLSSSPAMTRQPALSSPEFPADIISDAIEFYFKHIHRQPLWLFEQESLPPLDTCHELSYVILALYLTYSTVDLNETNLRSPEFYTKAARRLIMLRIADGTMNLQSTQALCLLAFFALISGDVSLAGFDISMVENVTQYSALQHHTSNNGSAIFQVQSKLFWSIHFLRLTCGAPALVPSIAENIDSPLFSTLEPRHSFTACPPLPRDPCSINRDTVLPDIWSESLKVCSLWGDVRLYVWKCIEGVAKSPWLLESDYTILCSRLLEVETTYPTALSYNSVNFPSLSPEETQENRSAWLPWLRVQISYHAIHCVLNHPFLYSVMAEAPSSQRLGANTFWSASYEKALRHCTWISRLIRMAREKGLELADPFFAQAAAIASTLHLYWTRTSNKDLQTLSLENLDICRALITQMATHWPVCRLIEQALDQFIDLVDSSAHQKNPKLTPTTAKISLIWTLLDIAAPQFLSFSGNSTSGRNLWSNGDNNNNEDPAVLARSEMHTPPPSDMRESTAHYASPPSWITSRPVCTGTPGGTIVQQEEELGDLELASQQKLTGGLAWGSWAQLMSVGDTSITDMNWWDMNNF